MPHFRHCILPTFHPVRSSGVYFADVLSHRLAWGFRNFWIPRSSVRMDRYTSDRLWLAVNPMVCLQVVREKSETANIRNDT